MADDKKDAEKPTDATPDRVKGGAPEAIFADSTQPFAKKLVLRGGDGDDVIRGGNGVDVC